MSDAVSSKRWAGWLVWGIAAAFYAYEFIHRVAPSVMTVQLRESLSLNSQQLGQIGAMYFYAYAAFQLPAGIIMDRFGTKNVLVLASLSLTFGSFLFTAASSSFIANISRFIIGAGSAFAFVGCLKIANQWLPKRNFPFVVGLTNLCGTLGALLGGTPLAYTIVTFGWRETFFYFSFIGLIITGLLLIFLNEMPSTENTDEPSESHQLFKGFLLVVRNPHSWVIGLYGALLVAPIAALPEMWGVEYLQVAYQLASTEASHITHTIFIGTAIGGPLIGWFMIKRKDPVDVMMLATFFAIILLTLFLYGFRTPSPWMYPVLLFYGFFTVNMLLCFTLMTQAFPLWAQGAAIGFTNMIIMTLAGGIQHLIGGILEYLHVVHPLIGNLPSYEITLALLPFCLLLAMGLTLLMSHISEQPLSVHWPLSKDTAP